MVVLHYWYLVHCSTKTDLLKRFMSHYENCNVQDTQKYKSKQLIKMRMFKYLTLALLFCCFCSCTEEDHSETTYRKTFITGYLSPESIHAGQVDSGIKLTLKGSMITSGGVFDSLSKTYNDISYNRHTNLGFGPHIAIDEGVHEIKIETVGDFDSSHPAGSDISELAECSYISYYDYIQSGYKETEKDVAQYSDLMEYFPMEGAKILKNKLSNLNSTNTKLASHDFVLKFNKEPERKGNYQFKLILQMSEKRIETFCEYVF